MHTVNFLTALPSSPPQRSRAQDFKNYMLMVRKINGGIWEWRAEGRLFWLSHEVTNGFLVLGMQAGNEQRGKRGEMGQRE